MKTLLTLAILAASCARLISGQLFLTSQVTESPEAPAISEEQVKVQELIMTQHQMMGTLSVPLKLFPSQICNEKQFVLAATEKSNYAIYINASGCNADQQIKILAQHSLNPTLLIIGRMEPSSESQNLFSDFVQTFNNSLAFVDESEGAKIHNFLISEVDRSRSVYVKISPTKQNYQSVSKIILALDPSTLQQVVWLKQIQDISSQIKFTFIVQKNQTTKNYQIMDRYKFRDLNQFDLVNMYLASFLTTGNFVDYLQKWELCKNQSLDKCVLNSVEHLTIPENTKTEVLKVINEKFNLRKEFLLSQCIEFNNQEKLFFAPALKTNNFVIKIAPDSTYHTIFEQIDNVTHSSAKDPMLANLKDDIKDVLSQLIQNQNQIKESFRVRVQNMEISYEAQLQQSKLQEQYLIQTISQLQENITNFQFEMRYLQSKLAATYDLLDEMSLNPNADLFTAIKYAIRRLLMLDNLVLIAVVCFINYRLMIRYVKKQEMTKQSQTSTVPQDRQTVGSSKYQVVDEQEGKELVQN